MGQERTLTAHQVHRSAFLRSRLSQKQSAVGEIERGQPDLARRLGAARLPVQPAGDHQMEDQKQIVLQFEDDALA